MDPVTIVVLVLLGALAGWLAGLVMKTSGGFLVNLIVGILGSVIGGWLLGGRLGGGMLGQFATAVIGAIILLFVVGLFTKKRR
ncbi:MAG: GlsB/YeaQ/YmgE family stress response membrane protein [Bacteroidales bacterium]|nr:GlsB/YeaQ/YmgE family stress response membrane protein [Bacteroidales bacterium]